jgi:hypothetical protein
VTFLEVPSSEEVNWIRIPTCFTKRRICSEIAAAIWRFALQVSYFQQQIKCLALETVLTDGVQSPHYCDTVNKHITML